MENGFMVEKLEENLSIYDELISAETAWANTTQYSSSEKQRMTQLHFCGDSARCAIWINKKKSQEHSTKNLVHSLQIGWCQEIQRPKPGLDWRTLKRYILYRIGFWGERELPETVPDNWLNSEQVCTEGWRESNLLFQMTCLNRNYFLDLFKENYYCHLYIK